MIHFRRSSYLNGLATLILTALLAVTAAVAQVSPGATKEEVIRILGWPKSTSHSDEREILNYPECTVLMKDGRVEKLVFKSADGRLHLWNQLNQPRDTFVPTNSGRVSPTAAPPTPQSRAPTPRATLEPPTPIRFSDEPSTDSGMPFWKIAMWVVIVFGVAVIILRVVLNDGTQLSRLQRDLLRKGVKQPSPGNPPIIPFVPPHAPTPKRKPDPLLDGWTLNLLNDIEWHRFEQVVVAYEKALGHDARLTDFGPDGGIDAKVFDGTSGQLTRLIQCKAYNHRVKVDFVRALYGVMGHEGISCATFYTTDEFSREGIEFAQGKNLELVDGPSFIARIKQLDLPNQIRLFEVATDGDYLTPTCPSCGIKMRLVPRKIGRDFWGCRNYPKCRTKIFVSRD